MSIIYDQICKALWLVIPHNVLDHYHWRVTSSCHPSLGFPGFPVDVELDSPPIISFHVWWYFPIRRTSSATVFHGFRYTSTILSVTPPSSSAWRKFVNIVLKPCKFLFAMNIQSFTFNWRVDYNNVVFICFHYRMKNIHFSHQWLYFSCWSFDSLYNIFVWLTCLRLSFSYRGFVN